MSAPINFQEISPDQALKQLLGIKDKMVTIYLPFGAYGKEEDHCRIHRKNLLKQLKPKLFNSELASMIAEIISDLNEYSVRAYDIHSDSTVAYFFNESVQIKTIIPGVVTPHYSWHKPAELEPLIYTAWAGEKYWLVDLDLEKPQLSEGHAQIIKQVPLIATSEMRELVGENLNEFSYRHFVNSLELNDYAHTGKNLSPSLIHYGYADKQASAQDLHRTLWLRFIADAVDEKVQKSPISRVLVLGSDEITRLFITLIRNQLSDHELIPITRRTPESVNELAIRIASILTARRLADTEKELSDRMIELRIAKIAKLAARGKIRKLYVQRRAHFSKTRPYDSKHYQYDNERINLITEALNRGAECEYTDAKIDNDLGIAAWSNA